jgi:ribosomal protein S18 acetylase RimI-like enzyme
MSVTIRGFSSSDLERLKEITIESFSTVSFDQMVESRFGILGGHDWRWRKAQQIDADVSANPQGVFVAEESGEILGYITTTVDREASKGRIPNMAVVAAARGKGIGRALIQHALDYFKREGLALAVIETMQGNETGKHLYSSCGFDEISRQIQFAVKL